VLAPATRDAVLERLGFSAAPEPDLAGLGALYAAWGHTVPFDNVVKRIHMASGSADPIPNGPPEAFFERFLRDGTGGTCWPSSGALHAFLVSVGFDARRGSAAMRDDVAGPVHTHGTVLVTLDGPKGGTVDYWVDSSMLTERVFPVVPGAESQMSDPVHQVRVEAVDPYWRVWWTHPFMGDMIGCLLLDDDVTGEHYLARYEWSREVSPFNTFLNATKNIGDGRVTLSFGQRWERTADGVSHTRLEGDDRIKTMVEEFGFSEEVAVATPPDEL
jgi:N-hydroxyarylamine O-acetyltransferase